MHEPQTKCHLNVGGWTTACGIESHDFVDKHKPSEYFMIDCKRCLRAMERLDHSEPKG